MEQEIARDPLLLGEALHQMKCARADVEDAWPSWATRPPPEQAPIIDKVAATLGVRE